MKVLIVTQAFPPFNTSGAVRVGKLVSFLAAAGHDVRVLTASPLPYPRTLPLNLPERTVITTRSADPLVLIQKLRSPASSTPAIESPSTARQGALARRLMPMLAPIAIPEPQIGWYPFAVAAGRRLLRGWQPDAIYASALPFTAHLVASALARRAGVPWIAEFRDHFSGNPYSNLPAWRAPIDRWLEQRVLRSAAACVTVSEPMAAALRARHHKPAIVVLNGYDDADHPPLAGTGETSDRRLQVVYTGVIYPGRRDPSALFAAVQSLGPLAERVQMTFYGQDLRGVADAAARHGVSANVHVRGAVAYQQSLEAQHRADILLLLLWNDPREAGVYTGKLFEYVGAARPVLAVGAEDGVAADLIRSRGLGVAAANAESIALALRRWIEEKGTTGRVAGPTKAARAGLSRGEQFALVDELLRDVARSTVGADIPARNVGSRL